MSAKNLYLKLYTSTNDLATCRVMAYSVVYDDAANERSYHKFVRYDDEYDVADEAFVLHGISREEANEKGISFDEYIDDVSDLIANATCVYTFGGVTFDLVVLARDFATRRKVLNISKKFVYDALDIERILVRNTFDEVYKRRVDANGTSWIHGLAAPEAIKCIVESQKRDIKSESTDDEIRNQCRTSLQRLTVDGRVQRDESGFLIVTFGKNVGKRIVDLARNDAGYMRWLFDTSSVDTRVLIRDEYQKLSTNG